MMTYSMTKYTGNLTYVNTTERLSYFIFLCDSVTLHLIYYLQQYFFFNYLLDNLKICVFTIIINNLGVGIDH